MGRGERRHFVIDIAAASCAWARRDPAGRYGRLAKKQSFAAVRAAARGAVCVVEGVRAVNPRRSIAPSRRRPSRRALILSFARQRLQQLSSFGLARERRQPVGEVRGAGRRS